MVRPVDEGTSLVILVLGVSFALAAARSLKEQEPTELLDWASHVHCVRSTKAEKEKLEALCNPYTEGGSTIHSLRGTLHHQAFVESAHHNGTVASERMLQKLALVESTIVPLHGSNGELASWTIGNPNMHPGHGYTTVLVDRTPCAAHGCCSAKIALRPNSTDLLSLKAFFGMSEYRFLLDIPLKPKYILDVGGVGMSAIWLSLLYPEANVYRLEPNPDNFAAGVRNAMDFPNIRQFNVGLWNRNTVLQMCNMVEDDWGEDWPFRDEHGNLNSQQQGFYTLAREEGECGSKAADDITVVLLSEFMRLMSIPRFDLIKMDIEAAEAKVFSGDPGIKDILKQTQIFVAETHERFVEGSAAPMREAFRDLGYRQFLDDENEIFMQPGLLLDNCKAQPRPSSHRHALGSK